MGHGLLIELKTAAVLIKKYAQTLGEKFSEISEKISYKLQVLIVDKSLKFKGFY